MEDKVTEDILIAVDFDPFAGPSIGKVVPSTDPQKEIWVSCIMGGDEANLAYNESISLQLKGAVKEEILKDTIFELVARNEALRSSFNNDGTRMIIYAALCPPLHYQDLSSLEVAAQQMIIDDYHRKDAETVFDLLNGPLVRFALFKQSENRVLLTINKHHIISDGWSSGIILEELCGIYNAKLANRQLPQVPLQFSDYALKALQFSATEEYKTIENYWINTYKDDVPVFEIPPDFPRPPLRTYKASRNDYIIEKEFADSVKKTGASYGCSFVNTLMVAFEVLLYKYTGHKDIVIGLPTAGQAATEMYNLVGHCVNSLPLRSRPDDELSFAAYLKKRKSKILSDYENQQFTFGSLIKNLNIARDPSRIPLMPVSYNIDIGMTMKVGFDNLTYEVMYNPRVCETFEIFLNISEVPQGYMFQWSYNTQLYKAATIKGLMDKYVFLLKQIVNNPQQKIRDLHLEDLQTLTGKYLKWNDTAKELPQFAVAGLFENIVSAYPERVGVIFQDEKITYNDLNQSANRLAHYLLQQGIKKGDIIGVVLDRGPQIVITLLAIQKCGAAYLALDPVLPQERINFMLQDAQAKFIITSEKYSGKLLHTATEIVLENIQTQLSSFPTANTGIKTGPDDTVYVLYTSGSTGIPKGVMVSYGNLLNLLTAMRDMFDTGIHTKLLSVTTISFDIVGLELYLPLISGGELVLTSEEESKNGNDLIRLLKKYQINFMQATPVTYRIMLESGWAEKLPVVVLCCGEPLPKTLANKLIPLCKELYNMYGPTETTIYSTGTQVLATDAQITIGRPIQNTQVYILDKNRNLLPANIAGEIYIGGTGVATGYLNRPELIAAHFLPDPFSKKAGARIYKTGDLGKYLEDGNIVCLGRTDDQVKLRGYRIELGEIDYQVSKLAAIKDVVTIVREDNPGDQRLVSYITLKEGGQLAPEQAGHWRETLKQNLPDYMVPGAFVVLDELPLTANGKVDKKLLPRPEIIHLATAEDPNVPLTEAEKIIKNIWEEELGIKNISIYSDFFELGGHSMIAIKMMSKIEQETGVKLPIALLFKNATIQSLAQLLAAKEKIISENALVPIKTSGKKTPIYLIHGGGLNILLYKSLAAYLDEDQPLYGLQGLGINGDLTHLSNIQTIAARYLDEILPLNPDGPYILAGYSLGGIIAYEMAKQLLAKGKEIKKLVIFDTNVGNRVFVTGVSKFNKKLIRQFKKGYHFSRSFLYNPKETLKYQALMLEQKFHFHLIDEDEYDKVYDYSAAVANAYNSAYYNYIMEPLNVKVDLFRVAKRIYYLDDPVYLGWQNFALKGVNIHIVPGDHKTFLFPPNNKKLAYILQKVANDKN